MHDIQTIIRRNNDATKRMLGEQQAIDQKVTEQVKKIFDDEFKDCQTFEETGKTSK